MKPFRRFLCLIMALCLLSADALAATSKATPTPPPTTTESEVAEEVPPKIQELLDLAYNEWETLNGKRLARSNKYTKWRNKYEWGWCAGFITWCMLQIDVPMERMVDIDEGEVEGIVHVKEASVGKLLRGYQKMNRATNIPQKGFLLVYGVAKSANRTTHVGLVWDVEDLGNGRYRITTIEGNMSNTVRMYIHDYDVNAPATANLFAVPEEERTRKETANFTYKLQDKKWYVNRFLMPWVPEQYTPAATTADPTPAPSVTPPPPMLELTE